MYPHFDVIMSASRNYRNSEVSFEGSFKYAVSKKSNKKRSNKINWMPQSNVRLTVEEEDGNLVFLLIIDKLKDQFFKLTKDNICGLETGKIIAPVKLSSCFSRKTQEKSNPYLLIVLQENLESQMILLLHSNTEEEHITKQWKWNIQNKLGFGRSWPNLDLEYSNGKELKISSEKTTLMLGRTWLAFFKYVHDSLPCFWKRFNMNDIAEIRLLDSPTTLTFDVTKQRCLIKFDPSADMDGPETFTILSGRSNEIYNFIESYRSTPNVPQYIRCREDSIISDPPTIETSTSPRTTSHEYSSSELTSTDFSLSDDQIQIYPVPDVHVLSSRLKKLQDIYIHPKIPKECIDLIPKLPILGDDPPPAPCGLSRKSVFIKDFGYIDRPYLPMQKVKHLPKLNNNGYDPYTIQQYKLNYITLPYTSGTDEETVVQVNDEHLNCEDPFSIIPQRIVGLKSSLYALIPYPPPCRSPSPRRSVLNPLPFDVMPTINSLEGSFNMVDAAVNTDSTLIWPSKVDYFGEGFDNNDSNVQFDFFSDDVQQFYQQQQLNINMPDLQHSLQMNYDWNDILPPSPHKTRKKYLLCSSPADDKKKFKRSFSENEVYHQRQNDDHTIVKRKLEEWSNEKNFTLSTNTGKAIKKCLKGSQSDDDDDATYSVCSDYEIDRSYYGYLSEGNSIYDLNMLTFPLNNLDREDKKEVFRWMVSIMKSNRNQQRHDNVPGDTCSDKFNYYSDNKIDENKSGVTKENYTHGVKMRRSVSQSAGSCVLAQERRTSSVIYGYWSATNICRTLDKVLSNKPPLPDTLGLSIPKRRELCLRLYTNDIDIAKHDWEALGEAIGLTVDCISVIQCCLQNQPLRHTAGEIVLRHWQFIYNKYWKDVEKDRTKCPYPCTIETLLYILQHKLERPDLVQLLQSDSSVESYQKAVNIAVEKKGKVNGTPVNDEDRETALCIIQGKKVGTERSDVSETFVKRSDYEMRWVDETPVKITDNESVISFTPVKHVYTKSSDVDGTHVKDISFTPLKKAGIGCSDEAHVKDISFTPSKEIGTKWSNDTHVKDISSTSVKQIHMESNDVDDIDFDKRCMDETPLKAVHKDKAVNNQVNETAVQIIERESVNSAATHEKDMYNEHGTPENIPVHSRSLNALNAFTDDGEYRPHGPPSPSLNKRYSHRSSIGNGVGNRVHKIETWKSNGRFLWLNEFSQKSDV